MSEAPLPRCFGVYGQPIAHSRSPLMHGAAFEALGLPHRYLPFAVAPANLTEAVRGAAALGFGGVNLTVPHKQAALALCDELSPAAARIGAVNTLRFVPSDPNDEERARGVAVHGHNTDARGLAMALERDLGSGLTGQLRNCHVLGSGGSARAAWPASCSLSLLSAMACRKPSPCPWWSCVPCCCRSYYTA